MGELNEDVRRQLGFLLEQGFVVGSVGGDTTPFGDTSVELVRADIRIRVSRDRGQEFVEFGTNVQPTEWFDLPLLLHAISGESDAERNPPVSLPAAASLLRRNWPVLEHHVSGAGLERLRLRIRLLERAREQRFLSRTEDRDEDETSY